MTTFYPDVSQFQAGLQVGGVPVLCARSSEGNWLVDPYFGEFKAQAASHGSVFFGYHFLESRSSPASQAALAHSILGSVPAMLDFEPIARAAGPHGVAMGSSLVLGERGWLRRTVAKALGGYISAPTMADAAGFIDAYRALGGRIHAVYLPRWYWLGLGSPSLEPFAHRNCFLVSSAYPGAYSDSGEGWDAYGGLSPRIWQYTSTHLLNGYRVDYNAYKGSPGGLARLVATGTAAPPPPPPPPPPPSEEDDMVVLNLPAAGPATVLPVPAGKTKLHLYADSGWRVTSAEGAPEVRVQVLPWDKLAGHPLLPTWEKPATLSLPAGTTQVSLARLDTGTVPVTATFS